MGRLIGLQRYRNALCAFRCCISRRAATRGGGTAPTTPPTSLEQAILHREALGRLFDRGLTHFPYRLDPQQWTQERCVLRMLEPTVAWLPVHLKAVIETTRRVAVEQRASSGIWSRLQAASFQTWTRQLVEALEQYRHDCEALRGTDTHPAPSQSSRRLLQ